MFELAMQSRCSRERLEVAAGIQPDQYFIDLV
jgi:hypothetical protein